jgi:NADPH-dependent 2,4-dienoyl-CoA reductase/sulfur reductase-like enzyme
MKLGARAVRLDTERRCVELLDGSHCDYDGLVIATGARPRTLPTDLSGVHTLRTLADALAFKQALAKQPKVCIVGAGFIGLEVAASCRALGISVQVVEPMALPLENKLGAAMAARIVSLHADHGVTMHTGVSVKSLEGHRAVEAVQLSDGRTIEANAVIVGIGVLPNTEWLEGSGIALDNGVVCDAYCRTNASNAVAAGDVARWHNPLFGVPMRIEHWTNAVEQAAAAAATLLSFDAPSAPFAPVPYFWSDQFGVKIQFAGYLTPSSKPHVVEDSHADRKLVTLYEDEGRLTGVLAWGRPQVVMKYRQRIAEGAMLQDVLSER